MELALSEVTVWQMMIFVCVAEHQGFAKASGYLHMTQSAVSKSIARLEKELGIVLFLRTTREIHLTEAGKILYEDWRVLVKEMQKSYHRALVAQSSEASVLHIGLLSTARPETYFWALETQFKKEYPEIQLELESEYMTDLEEKLFSGYYDAVMIPDFERYTIESQGMHWKWAACTNAYVLMSKHHSLAKRDYLQTKDILGEKYVILDDGHHDSYMRDLQARFAPYHVTPQIDSRYKNAYSLKYLFTKKYDALLFTDAYFDFIESEEICRIPVIDQVNGIICAWSPDNQKAWLNKFIGTLSTSHGN